MAGLFIKELMLRGDLKRCLIVAPGALVEQWQDELEEKFDLSFHIVARGMIQSSYSGNQFRNHDRLIMRLDMASRSDDIQAMIDAAPEFDLVICDEALLGCRRPTQAERSSIRSASSWGASFPSGRGTFF